MEIPKLASKNDLGISNFINESQNEDKEKPPEGGC